MYCTEQYNHSKYKQHYFPERKFVTLYQQIKNNYLDREQDRIWYVYEHGLYRMIAWIQIFGWPFIFCLSCIGFLTSICFHFLICKEEIIVELNMMNMKKAQYLTYNK